MLSSILSEFGYKRSIHFAFLFLSLGLLVGVFVAGQGGERWDGAVSALPEEAAVLPGVTNEWWAVVKGKYFESKPDIIQHTNILRGTGEFLPATPDWMAEGNISGAEFGLPAFSTGDLNGDGYDDIVVGGSTT
jgi:hypothetical protein